MKLTEHFNNFLHLLALFFKPLDCLLFLPSCFPRPASSQVIYGLTLCYGEVGSPACYIWVSPTLWHRGVTYPHCARSGVLLRAPQLTLCHLEFLSMSEVQLSHMENHPTPHQLPHLSFYCAVNVPTLPTESPVWGREEVLLSQSLFFFSTQMTTDQEIHFWHFPHPLCERYGY